MEIPEIVRLYAPISKIDEEKRMVYGYATTPTQDSQSEVVDLDASFEAVDEWKEWANIKEMHRSDTAAGIAPIIEKHVGVGVYIGAEIVDDQAWRKCQKKVYKGFSIGGSVIERKGNRITKYRLNEVSLVDRPANPDSIFMVAKRDDTHASVMEAEGGISVENKQEAPSIPATVGETSVTPPIAETEALAKTAQEIKPETVLKADFDALLQKMAEKDAELAKRDSELAKYLAEKKEQDMVADAVIKALERLEPKIKKVHDEVKPKTDEEKADEMKGLISKMSAGELTAYMLKHAPIANAKE